MITRALLLGILCVLCVVQLVVSIPKLSERGMWSDELFTASLLRYHPLDSLSFERKQVTQINPADSFLTVKSAEQHPPLYDLALKVWGYFAGDSAFALRLFSLLCLILVSFVLIFVAFLYPEKRLLLTTLALVLAVLPTTQVYAIQSRSYTFSVLVSTLVLCSILVRARQPKSNSFRWVYLAIGISFATHYYMAVFTGLLYLLVIGYQFKVYREVSPSALVPATVVLVWGFFSYHSILSTAAGGVAWEPISFSESLLSMFSFLHDYLGLLIYLVLPSLVISAFKNRYLILTGYACVFVSILMLAIACSLADIQHPRHFIFFIPWVLYLILEPIFDVISTPIRWATSIIMIAGAIFAPPPENAFPHHGYDEAARFLVENWDAEQAIYGAWAANRSYYQYYLDDYSSDGRELTMLSNERDVDELCQQISKGSSPLVANLAHKKVIQGFTRCLRKHSEVTRQRFRNIVVIHKVH